MVVGGGSQVCTPTTTTTSTTTATAILLSLLPLVVCIAICYLFYKRGEAIEARVKELEAQVAHKEDSRQKERAGRIRLEKELRELVSKRALHPSSSTTSTTTSLSVYAIGTIRSCFKDCVGTPRQGLMAPTARARIDLHPAISPTAMEGLEGFSHVWVTFIFHLNTNVHRNSKAHLSSSSSSTTTGGRVPFTFPAKITPPMLKRRVGLLSTRSPHRPNPLGVTLARLDRVCYRSRALHLSAVDLVEGTPVLDIKPYVPYYDSLPAGQVVVPEWIVETVGSRRVVVVVPAVVEEAVRLEDQWELYRGEGGALVETVKEVLAADIRSPHQEEVVGVVYTRRIDSACVDYVVEKGEQGVVVVVQDIRVGAGLSSSSPLVAEEEDGESTW